MNNLSAIEKLAILTELMEAGLFTFDMVQSMLKFEPELLYDFNDGEEEVPY